MIDLRIPQPVAAPAPCLREHSQRVCDRDPAFAGTKALAGMRAVDYLSYF
jgi:hypothetical protein